jgi:hypothetical protein
MILHPVLPGQTPLAVSQIKLLTVPFLVLPASLMTLVSLMSLDMAAARAGIELTSRSAPLSAKLFADYFIHRQEIAC